MNQKAILDQLRFLSFSAMGLSSPNPPVACVITDKDGNILSTGSTSKYGGFHAERNAYLSCKVPLVDGEHRVFVTLEPCSHYGKTPPCLDLILQSKPSHLVIGEVDPNPLVRKRDGLQECKRNGIEVVIDPEIQRISKAFLMPFFSRIQKSKPVKIIKSALSQEGFFCPSNYARVQLSCTESNQLVQLLRAKVDAVLVGSNTTFVDSPSLSYRGYSQIHLPKAEGNDIFLDTLLEYSGKQDVLENEDIVSYQPYRCFIVEERIGQNLQFLESQKRISDQFPHRKPIFFALKGSLSLETISKLEAISHIPVVFMGKEETVTIVEQTLFSLGVNTYLIEGGNSLYSAFSSSPEPEDRLLFIRTPKKLGSGILPNCNRSPFQQISTAAVGVDIWENYKCV